MGNPHFIRVSVDLDLHGNPLQYVISAYEDTGLAGELVACDFGPFDSPHDVAARAFGIAFARYGRQRALDDLYGDHATGPLAGSGPARFTLYRSGGTQEPKNT